jgi:class 3 adenylate cyclase/tetratricopeptide (TPR) repeat protein
MLCHACGGDVPPDSRFCPQCGAPRVRECPHCGESLPDNARFCPACGRALGDAPGAAPAPRAHEGPLGERRQATVLFSDLSGYTEMNERLDPEEVEGYVNRLKMEAVRIVERHGGVVNQFVGDEVLALFGVPVAHADDPLRAVRAAQELHAMVRELSPEVEHRLAQPLRLHTGINSGLLVTSRGDERGGRYTITGDTVNTGARLVSLAAADEILVGPDTHLAIAAEFAAEALPAARLKGKAAPIVPYRIGGAAPGQSGEGLPLVGRQAELRQLDGILVSCRAAGRGMAVLLQGEAGIGKTRLVAECEALARAHGFACHKGLVLDFGEGQGRDAVRSLARSVLGLPPLAESRGNAVQGADERLLAQDAVAPEQRVFLNDLLDLPQSTELHALYDAMDNETRNRGKRATLAALVRHAGARHPLLLVMEDVHWADPQTLAHLDALGSAVAELPAVLLMTARPAAEPPRAGPPAASLAAAQLTLRLTPLRSEEARTLAEAFPEVDARTAQGCVERAGGNPLFLEQLLRSAREGGAAGALPGTVQSAVQARVDHLAGADKQAIQAAAAIGQRFELELLRHLLGDATYDCAELLAQRLVRREELEFHFAHALVQEGVYQSTLKARRRELHGRAAEWLAGRDATLRAEHLARAEDPAAAGAFVQAAREQAAAYRYERAQALLRRGLELAREPAERFELHCLRGELLHDLGAIEESSAEYREALELAADDAQRAQAHIGLASALRIQNRHQEALAELARAEPAARAAQQTHLLARLHNLRGNVLFPLGDGDGCLREHELALQHATAEGSTEYEARAYSGLADAYYVRGRMRTAFEHFERCVAMSREHGYGRIEVANRHMCGWTRIWLNQLERAQQDAAEAIAMAEAVNHPRALMLAHILPPTVELGFLGRSERSQASIERSLELARQFKAVNFEAQGLLNSAMAGMLRGEREAARERCEAALAMIRETGMRFVGPHALVCLARLSDDPARRESCLAEAEALLAEGCVGHCYFLFYRDALLLCCETGDWPRMARYADALEAYTAQEPLPFSDLAIRMGRSLAAWGQGRRKSASAGQLAALGEECRAVGFLLGAAQVERVLARS